MKEQGQSSEKQLNEIEAGKLQDTEFKTMLMRILKELSENVNSIRKDMEPYKKEPVIKEGYGT